MADLIMQFRQLFSLISALLKTDPQKSGEVKQMVVEITVEVRKVTGELSQILFLLHHPRVEVVVAF